MSGQHPFQEFVNPHLGDLLQVLGLDRRFVQGAGTELRDHAGRVYLDFLAGYGAVPFGHNPPALWEAIARQQASGEPGLVQPALLDAAGELAQSLIALAPGDLRYVSFANSGAEAVEAALKACRAATGRWGVISARHGFHGKTLGALSATAAEHYQAPFGGPVAGHRVVPYGDIAALAATLAEVGQDTAAVILEPIQGEGGVNVPPADYLPAVRALCDEYGVLLVFDEVQTGLGRTGALFACQSSGVYPDCLTLAKALGGGLVPMGACLLNQRAYSEAFALKHSSTFAGNTLACRVGLAALALLTADDGALLQRVRERGRQLRSGLEALVQRYPRVLSAVRGEGLLLGLVFSVERADYPADWGALLGLLGEQQDLLPLVASHLLEVHGIRTAPTLNHQSVLRIEPPLTVSEDECETFLQALEATVAVLDAGDSAAFTRHLVPGAELRPPHGAPTRRRQLPSPAQGEGRFAFLVPMLEVENYLHFDRSLARFQTADLEALTHRLGGRTRPFVHSATRIQAASGATAHGEFIVVPTTPGELARMNRRGAVSLVGEAVDLARRRGARIVGLGGHTSVIAAGGTLLADRGVAITTGNSYTVVAALEAVDNACRRLGQNLGHCRVAVVGAGGAIGMAVVGQLLGRVGGLCLVGNPAAPWRGTRQRFQAVLSRALGELAVEGAGGRLARTLETLYPHDTDPVDLARSLLDDPDLCPDLQVSIDPARALADCDVVVVATSSTEKLIEPTMLKPGAVVCDLSRPTNVSREMIQSRPDVLVIDGGVVAVPGRADLNWYFGFPRGLVYACMAETMMLALEQRYQHTSLGRDLDRDTQDFLAGAAARHGFGLAALRSFDRPMTGEDWQHLLAARAQALTPSLALSA